MSELAVTELQGNADHVTSLEGEVERLSTSVQEQEGKVQTLQVVSYVIVRVYVGLHVH